MNSNNGIERHVAFLRGINVGGHHKVPMEDLRIEFEKLGFKNVQTLLNSGNIIFDADTNSSEDLEKLISVKLEKTFGFPIPTIIRNAKTINQLFSDAPFSEVNITKDIRLYVSFLKNEQEQNLDLPWNSSDNSYCILENRDKTILSVLDLSVSKTPRAMKVLETYFGTDITTRNWNTIERIVKKL